MARGARGTQRVELVDQVEARKRLHDLKAGKGQLCAVQKFSRVARAEDAEDDDEDRGAGKIAFIITDESEDRYEDTISVDGWDFKAFNTNPVLLYAHDYASLPLGRMGEPWKTNGKRIKAEVEKWATQDENPMAPAVESMLRRGILNTVSVGFLPKEFEFKDNGGIGYTAQELLEVSVVPVPANANALLQAKELGLWLPSVQRWIEKTVDERRPGMPFEIAQKALAVVRPTQVQVKESIDDAGPLPEVLALTKAVEANTVALREQAAALEHLAGEIRQDREVRVADSIEVRARRIADAVKSRL